MAKDKMLHALHWSESETRRRIGDRCCETVYAKLHFLRPQKCRMRFDDPNVFLVTIP
jgi:hypothetical protein